MFKKIILFTLPWLCLLGVFRLLNPNSTFLPSYDVIMNKIAKLPDLRSLLVNDIIECRDTFLAIPQSWSFKGVNMPTFDASSMTAFFQSIGRFFTSLAVALGDYYRSLLNLIVAVLEYFTSIFRVIFNTVVNVLAYIIGILDIIFGY